MEFLEVAAVDDLAEGEMIPVEVAGKRVLLAQIEGSAYAMGAICTHERTHLDQGTLVGHEVTCPLHFSCFDVRTGEPTAPPAEKPADVYQVKVEDGKVLVSSQPVEAPEPVETGAVDDAGAPGQEAAPPSEAKASGAALPAEEGRLREQPVAGVEEQPVAVDDASQPGATVSAPLLLPSAETHLPWQARVIEWLAAMGWLAEVSERSAALVTPVRSAPHGKAVFDVLHGRWFGHALHPALSDLPIGLWTGSALLDLAGADDDAAAVLSASGSAAALATAATGVADWSATDGPERRIGLLHGLLNTAGLALQGASLIARIRGRRRRARNLSFASLALSGASAYLGGHLVMGKGVMVDHTLWTSGPRQWTQAVREVDLIEDETLGVTVEGRSVLFSRGSGNVSAIEGSCSHAGGPLPRGQVCNGVVTCPWHGSEFNLKDGRVLKGPASHPQPVLETRLNGEWIEVRRRR